ncbi:MAG: hypothetical protein QOD75_3604 [Blastocatellia bacterium]|jgi:hypothetical protein|nr:hypothetical protein [Blastocatellia bacterium]
MSQSNADTIAQTDSAQPPLGRDERGAIDVDSLPEVIQWFLDYDQRVAVVRNPRVEEVFQWKQEQSRSSGEEVFFFNRAEDRVAIGILQALSEHANEEQLHSWMCQLLNALDKATKATEDVAAAYRLDLASPASVVTESEKIPAANARSNFLVNCWLETLCTAEVRVLGWLYQEFYGRPFRPDNF